MPPRLGSNRHTEDVFLTLESSVPREPARGNDGNGFTRHSPRAGPPRSRFHDLLVLIALGRFRDLAHVDGLTLG
jgi:hypothetical protein